MACIKAALSKVELGWPPRIATCSYLTFAYIHILEMYLSYLFVAFYSSLLCSWLSNVVMFIIQNVSVKERCITITKMFLQTQNLLLTCRQTTKMSLEYLLCVTVGNWCLIVKGIQHIWISLFMHPVVSAQLIFLCAVLCSRTSLR